MTYSILPLFDDISPFRSVKERNLHPMAKLIGGFHEKGKKNAMAFEESNLGGRNVPDNRDKDIVRKSLLF